MSTIPARNLGVQVTSYLRKETTFSDGETAAVTVGTVPAGSIIIRAGIVVKTAFNSGTTNTIHIGTSASSSTFGASIATGTAGVIVGTALATSTLAVQTADTSVVATHVRTGTAATTGDGYVFIEYMPIA